MISITHKENCCGCHACQSICPVICITMVPDNEGFLYPQVDLETCTDCGVCEAVCPMVSTAPQCKPPLAFAAWNRDEAIREDSSSGGVFHVLMQNAFQDHGVVFGAAFDENMQLRHRSAESLEEGLKLRGSKYVQSIMGDSYKHVRKYLQQGRKVLFSGTPCQIGGLYSFLGKDDPNLLTCDVVCHGVPSPKVLSAYQGILEKKRGGKTRRIAFRRKDCGWKRYSVSFSFDNETEYLTTFPDDPFMIGFLQNIYLRPSCYACRFSRIPRVADISLADFWGVGDHHPEWDDDKGTSLVIVQSGKGRKAFEACRADLVTHETDLNVAIQSNPCICGSVVQAKNRDAFFADLDRLSIEKIIKKYMAPPSRWRTAFNNAKRAARTGWRCLSHS